MERERKRQAVMPPARQKPPAQPLIIQQYTPPKIQSAPVEPIPSQPAPGE